MDTRDREPEEQDGVHNHLAGVSDNQDGVQNDLVHKANGREAGVDQKPIKGVIAFSTCQKDVDQGNRYKTKHREFTCIKGDASDWQV